MNYHRKRCDAEEYDGGNAHISFPLPTAEVARLFFFLFLSIVVVVMRPYLKNMTWLLAAGAQIVENQIEILLTHQFRLHCENGSSKRRII